MVDQDQIESKLQEVSRPRGQKNSETIHTVSPVKAALNLRDKSTKEQSSPWSQ